MTPRPRHPKPDANQGDIVDGLRDCGYLVHDVSAFIGEFDLLVYGLDWETQEHTWIALEVKMPDGVLTGKELQYQIDHPGAAHTVRSLTDALKVFGR